MTTTLPGPIVGESPSLLDDLLARRRSTCAPVDDLIRRVAFVKVHPPDTRRRSIPDVERKDLPLWPATVGARNTLTNVEAMTSRW